jgi:hypothetical protein
MRIGIDQRVMARHQTQPCPLRRVQIMQGARQDRPRHATL